MDDFRFSETQWDEISAALAQTGRLKAPEDRQTLERICGNFAQLRPRLGRAAPTPARARAAWGKVAAAAHKLDLAIKDLRGAGAADFAILDNHQGGAAAWAAQLPSIVEGAKTAGQLEMEGLHAVSNNTDLLRDGFVQQLVRVWKGYGGRISYAENGPLIRFLSAVTTPALICAGEDPMTADALRGIVRYRKAS